MTFEKYKRSALKSLHIAIEKRLVDGDILFLLEKINAIDDYYTTSSCYGRIVVSESTPDNKKKAYKFLGKWHRIVACEEVMSAINMHRNNLLFLRLEPLILHVGCTSMEAAERLLKVSKNAGFKRSGIYQTRPRIMVEIIGVDVLQVPLGKNGLVIADKKYLNFILNLANSKFMDNEKKIRYFAGEFSYPIKSRVSVR